ncbi:MAG: cytochrome c maturation protein CcmE [Deltaproteobacteria bacterium]|nr:cytochrome c maturation protein CcmE [Deltaproteobacteria bacterium]
MSSTTGPRIAAASGSTTGPRIPTVSGGTTGPRADVAAPDGTTEARGGIPKWAKILITVVVAGGGLGYLLYATAAPEVEWYKHVDEVMAEASTWQNKKLQLHGRVVKGSILRRPSGATYEYQFKVENNGRTVAARHTGLVPDTFKDEAEVVLKGRLTHHGYFQVAPDGVMAKCPSKYEARKK